MFGGAMDHVKTLDAVLGFVESEGPSTDELVEWYRDRFDKVSSRNSILRNVRYLQSVGFLERRGDRWEVGAQGREYRLAGDRETLVRIMCNRNVGLWSLMCALRDGPMSIKAINDQQLSTHEELGWDPEKTAMAKQRTNWLRSMKMIVRKADSYDLTEAGRMFLKKYEPPEGAQQKIKFSSTSGKSNSEQSKQLPQTEASPRIALTAELQEIHTELDRPLHPTDVVIHGELSAGEYTREFDSWGQAGEVAHVPVSDPPWKEAIVRELRLYARLHDEPTATLEDLCEAMEGRLRLLFPESDCIRPKIRGQLQLLKDDGNIDFATHEEKHASTTEDQPREAQGEEAEPLVAQGSAEGVVSVSQLENACAAVERSLRNEKTEQASDLLAVLRHEIDTLRESDGYDGLSADLQRRLGYIEERMGIADAAIETATQVEESEEGGGDADPQALLEDLEELSNIFGESPQSETVALCGRYAIEDYRERFQSWPQAIEAAGLDPIDVAKRDRRHFPRIDILQRLEKLLEELGRMPSKAEMEAEWGVSTTTVKRRLGGWDSVKLVAKRLVEGELHIGEPPDNEKREDGESTDEGESSKALSDTGKSSSEPEPPESTEEKWMAATEFAGVSSIQGASRIESPMAVRIEEVREDTHWLVDRTLLIEDLSGEQTELGIMGFHHPQESWEVGGWYVLEGAMGRSAADAAGEAASNIKTTFQFSATRLEERPSSPADAVVYDESALKEGDEEAPEEIEESTEPVDVDPDPDLLAEESAEREPPGIPAGDFATVAQLRGSGAPKRPTAVKMLGAFGHQGGPKSVTLEVEDTDGAQAKLIIWRYHAVDCPWKLGEWYIITGVEADTPSDQADGADYELTSTEEFSVKDPDEYSLNGMEQTTDGSMNETTDPSLKSGSDTYKKEGEEKGPDILGEIADDLEGL
jgi:hypothetical protein